LCVDWYLRTILDWHSINTRLTFHLHLSWHLIDTPLTSRLRDDQIFDRFIQVSQHWAICWSNVDRVSTEYQSGCWSSIDQDFDQGYWSRVSIDTQPQIPLLRMIPVFFADSSPETSLYKYEYYTIFRLFDIGSMF